MTWTTSETRAAVHDAGGLQSVLLRVLRLLAGVARRSPCGRANPADPRILQAPPPLAQPEGGEGVEPRGERGPGCLDNSELPKTESTDDHRRLRSPTSLEGLSAVGGRSGVCDRGCLPERWVTVSDSSPASGHGIGNAKGTRTENNTAVVPPRGGGPGFRAQDKPAEQSRELETLSGCQRLPAGSRVGECRRWTAQIGVSVDEDGALSARVLEGVTSTPREPHVLPFSGDLIGHSWSLGVDRILGPVEETVDTQKAADKRVYRMLELLGDELDAIRDGAEVHDAGGMQSVLLRVLRLLVGGAQTCGY